MHPNIGSRGVVFGVAWLDLEAIGPNPDARAREVRPDVEWTHVRTQVMGVAQEYSDARERGLGAIDIDVETRERM